MRVAECMAEGRESIHNNFSNTRRLFESGESSEYRPYETGRRAVRVRDLSTEGEGRNLENLSVERSWNDVHGVRGGSLHRILRPLRRQRSRHPGAAGTVQLIRSRLYWETQNQVGIAHIRGLLPVLKLLDSENPSLQQKAASVLRCFVDNERNVPEFIRVGGVQMLQDREFIAQATTDCVAMILKGLEEKIHGLLLSHLLYMMRVSEKAIQERVAIALAHLCSDPDDQKTIFIDNGGLELLLGLLGSTSRKEQLEGAVALFKLANKVYTLSPMDATSPSLTPNVYVGEKHINDSTVADVTFLVEGRKFYAHRICLLATSDAFRAMFASGFMEKYVREIEIPNIRWEVFELMMRYMYTASVDVTLDNAQDLLKAADQYLLVGLKQLCENTIAQEISLENVSGIYEFSETFQATLLKHRCILFILEQFVELSANPEHSHLIQHFLPEIKNYITKALTKV